MTKEKIIKRGEIYLIDFGEPKGSKQGGTRPAIVMQNNKGNYFSPTIFVCPLTTANKKTTAPIHVHLNEQDGVAKPSTALCEQAEPVNKCDIKKLLGKITSNESLEKIKNTIVKNIEGD